MLTPTDAQLRIRNHDGLGLLVVAPAGCGKTEALALRVAGLLEREDLGVGRKILVTTFSNRARDNIRDRLRSYLPGPVLRNRVSVSNFHGLSARLFRAHARTIGMDPEMLLPESDWVRAQCLSWNWGWEQIVPAEVALRAAKQVAADDDTVRALLEARDEWGAVQLEEQRIADHRLTYDDLPRFAELILAQEPVADLYRAHFGAVVVDEFQDLTPQQLRIVNAIGAGRTTFAGDLAQGIYGFAGAQPTEIDAAVRQQCPDVIEFAESHRSSPAVLAMVNSLNPLTGGLALTPARPDSWPGGGLAACITFDNPHQEAQWALWFAGEVIKWAPTQRIGLICRNAPRRETVDALAEQSGLPVFRWDDGVLDTETARLVKIMLVRIRVDTLFDTPDPLAYLRQEAEIDSIPDVDTRKCLAEALVWCLDKLHDGLSPAQIRERIRVGDQDTLLTAAGVHLLSGHVGKGQQFDWVIVVGAEDGVVPDFRSSTSDQIKEEARVLSVMISRARHGVVVGHATRVTDRYGRTRMKPPSRFFQNLRTAGPTGHSGVSTFVGAADWATIAAR
jgi:DNA helicase-2/ATP-dependent DNA helicase PcrA